MTVLYRLIYTSRTRFGKDSQEDAIGAGIVEAWRRNNAGSGVTGALLLSDGKVAQVLEGPRAAVEATFERIQRDPQHGDLNLLHSALVEGRIFPEWSMALIGHSARARALWNRLARSTGFGQVEGDGFCVALLSTVRTMERDETLPLAAHRDRFDVERLRSALDAERPDRPEEVVSETRTPHPTQTVDARPTPLPVAAKPEEAEPRVLRAALDDERTRTTALRQELDEMRIALARAGEESEGLGRQRDIWSDRSTQLRTSVKATSEGLRIAKAELDHLRARVASHDADMRALRLHRDIWADRAKALATALCCDPTVQDDEAFPTKPDRSVQDLGQATLIKVAG